ncbi:MAG: Sensory box histidine kinase/response regulator, partial [uncultured Microvirga sp.]
PGGRGRGRDPLRARHHRAAPARAAVRPGPEDAGRGPARGRGRARLQQRPAGDHRLFGPAAREPQADRPGLPGHHADQAERQPGREPGAPAACLFAPPDAAPGAPQPQRRALRPLDAAEAPFGRARRPRSEARARPVVRQGRREPVRAGHREPRGQRPRRHAGWRARLGPHREHFRAGGRRLEPHRAAGDRARPHRGGGHRHRHPARGDGQDFRALLHHQGGRQGHRARALDRVRHRQAVERLHLCRLDGRPRHGVPGLPAAPRADRGGDRRGAEARGQEAGRRPHRPGHHPARRGRGPGARRQRARPHGAGLHGDRGRLGGRGAAHHRGAQGPGRPRGVRRRDARDGRPDFAARIAQTLPRPESDLRLRLRRGRLQEEPSGRRGFQFPRKTLQPEAALRGREAGHRGV